MALLPSLGKKENDKEKCLPGDPDDDDFKPLPKRKKAQPDSDFHATFPKSTLSNCTFNINISK